MSLTFGPQKLQCLHIRTFKTTFHMLFINSRQKYDTNQTIIVQASVSEPIWYANVRRLILGAGREGGFTGNM